MKRTPSDFQFIVITLLFVSLLGVRTAYSLMEEDVAEVAVIADAEVTEGSRAPASVPSAIGEPQKSSLQSMMNFDLSCSKHLASSFKATGAYVQLRGKNCLKNFKQDQMQIINKSNGYTASIFSFGKDQYQTDMIQLIKGENEILIRYSSPGGVSFEKTIKVSTSSI